MTAIDAIALGVCVALLCHGQNGGILFTLALAYILLTNL